MSLISKLLAGGAVLAAMFAQSACSGPLAPRLDKDGSRSVERELADLIVYDPEGNSALGKLVVGFGFVEDTVVFSIIDRRMHDVGFTEIVTVDMAKLSADMPTSAAHNNQLSLLCRNDFPCIRVDRYKFGEENDGFERAVYKTYDVPIVNQGRNTRIIDMMNTVIGGSGYIEPISH